MKQPAKPSERFYPALDGLRGVSFLAVFAYHVALFTEIAGQAPADRESDLFKLLLGVGAHGVEIFFVLSGFLITGILLDAKASPRFAALRAFVFRRGLRILPLYYALLLALLWVPDVWPALPWLLTYTTNIKIGLDGYGAFPDVFHHYWSVSIEEQYYLVWPLIVLFTPRRLSLALAIFIWVACPVLRYLVHDTLGETAAYMLTFCRADGLALGGILAFCLRDLSPATVKRIAPWLLAVGAIGFACLFCERALALVPFSNPIKQSLSLLRLSQDDALLLAFGLPGLALAGGGIILMTVFPSPITRFFSYRAFRKIGRHSYAAYLLHQPLIVWLLRDKKWSAQSLFRDHYALAWALDGLWLFALTFALSLLAWWLIEAPALKLKKRFRYSGQR